MDRKHDKLMSDLGRLLDTQDFKSFDIKKPRVQLSRLHTFQMVGLNPDILALVLNHYPFIWKSAVSCKFAPLIFKLK